MQSDEGKNPDGSTPPIAMEGSGPEAGDYDKPDDLNLGKVGDDKPAEEKTM